MFTREWLMGDIIYQLAKLGYQVRFDFNLSFHDDGGHTDGDEVYVNLARSDWLPILAHEFGHVTQLRDARFDAFESGQAQRVYDARVGGLPVAMHEWKEAARIVEAYERDAEITAMWLCDGLIDRAAYTRKANAYLYLTRLSADVGAEIDKTKAFSDKALAAMPHNRVITSEDDYPRGYLNTVGIKRRRG